MLGILIRQLSENLVGFRRLPIEQMALPDHESGNHRFMGFRPIIDHRLESIPDRRIDQPELDLAMGPHQQRIRPPGASLVEGQKLVVFGGRSLVFSLQVKFFRDLQLMLFDLTQLGKGLERHLLQVVQAGRLGKRGKKDGEQNRQAWNQSDFFRASNHLLYSVCP